MLIQSDYHIHAAFYRIKKEGDAPGPTAAEQLAAARKDGSVYVGIVEHCNTAPNIPFPVLKLFPGSTITRISPEKMFFSGLNPTSPPTAPTTAAKRGGKSWACIM